MQEIDYEKTKGGSSRSIAKVHRLKRKEKVGTGEKNLKEWSSGKSLLEGGRTLRHSRGAPSTKRRGRESDTPRNNPSALFADT